MSTGAGCLVGAARGGSTAPGVNGIVQGVVGVCETRSRCMRFVTHVVRKGAHFSAYPRIKS